MKVQFKGSTKVYECTEPTEQKAFRSGAAAGWVVMFSLYGDADSVGADNLLTKDAVSELVFTGEGGASFALCGYETVTSCVIRHKEDVTITELQLASHTA